MAALFFPTLSTTTYAGKYWRVKSILSLTPARQWRSARHPANRQPSVHHYLSPGGGSESMRGRIIHILWIRSPYECSLPSACKGREDMEDRWTYWTGEGEGKTNQTTWTVDRQTEREGQDPLLPLLSHYSQLPNPFPQPPDLILTIWINSTSAYLYVSRQSIDSEGTRAEVSLLLSLFFFKFFSKKLEAPQKVNWIKRKQKIYSENVSED